MPDIYADACPKVTDKGASYTVLPQDNDKVLVFTAAATCTLPPIADVWNGWNVTVYNAVDDILVLTAPSGKLVTFNNIAATTLTTTASEHVGWGCRIIYDAALTKYIAMNMQAEAVTVTVG
jgi:hypothetical protein